MGRTVLVFVFVIATTIFLIGCGGDASPAPTTTTATPTPTPTTPTTPPSTGGGTGSGGTGSGGSGSSGATVQWLSTLGMQDASSTPRGQVTVDTAGNVNVQLTSGGTPNVQYTVSFTSYGAGKNFPVGNFTTDASGKANASMKFPQSGNWAGAFTVTHVSSDSFTTVGTAWAQTSAPLLPISTVPEVCSQTVCSAGTQDPGGGTLTTANGSQHVTLSGATANATYEVIECVFGGSSCFLEGNLNTDAAGNGTFDNRVEPSPGQVWRIQRVSGTPASAQGTGFVTAFKVP